MEEDVIAEGVRLFAENAEAKFSKESDTIFQVTFSSDKSRALIGVEAFGMAMSYATYMGVLSNPSFAPNLLKRNWGGVGGTCFYFSVHEQANQSLIVLETRQFINPDATAEDIASLLGTWRLQWEQAKESLQP